jgi:hypothetical protein
MVLQAEAAEAAELEAEDLQAEELVAHQQLITVAEKAETEQALVVAEMLTQTVLAQREVLA